MPFHVNNVLCKELDVKAAGTAYSDTLKTGVAKVGDVTPLFLEIWSPVNASDPEEAEDPGTLDIILQTSSDAFDQDVVDVLSLPQKEADILAKGKIFEGAIPSGIAEDIRLKFVTTNGFEVAKITAAIRS